MKSLQYRTKTVLTAFAVFPFLLATASAQEGSESQKVAKAPFEEIGEVQPIEDGEHRIGGTDRIFLVEDEWELNRCTQLLPKLPQIDTKRESLLVVMSWNSMPRTLKSIEAEQETLVIALNEEKSALERAGSYSPPKFFVYKLPIWVGPVRIEVNDEPRFTILREPELTERSNEIWEEILRLHSGGRPTLAQQVRRYKQMWRDMSEQEIKLHIMENKDQFRREDVAPYYALLFRDLVDMRAKPAIPRIFALIESMGKHDEAQRPATEALIGIGGSELVEHCHVARKSWNPRSRATGMGLLAAFALPDMRELARELIAELDRTMSLNALQILKRIGITKEDVPAMIHALEQVESFYKAKPEERPKLEYYDGEMGTRLIYALGELGADAEEALPVLERFTSDPRLPLRAFQADAQNAINKIKQSAPNATR
jgi:hypothetical protein